LTDATGAITWDARFRPFGEAHAIAGTAANDQRFPGQLLDPETGLHYNYFRDYDPTLGRYIESDPIGLAGGLNTYAYIDANPIRFSDPYGLQTEPALLTCAAGGPFNPICDAAIFVKACKWGATFLGGIGIAAMLSGDTPQCDAGASSAKSCTDDKDRDDECERLAQQDEAICRTLPDPGARARCWDSSAARYGACKAGKPLPPLITW